MVSGRLGRLRNGLPDKEGEKVEDRTDRPNEDHEIADELDIPALRFLYEGGVHVVCRDRHLGQVVEEVVEQNLCWEHGQERQEHKGAGHAEHVPEVRTGAHQQVLHYVPKRFASLNDALVEHIEALLKQDEFGCLLCHIDPRSNGDPYIGSVERGGIVDAVTQKAHYVMTLLECQNDAVLLRWRDTGKDVGRQVPEKTALPHLSCSTIKGTRRELAWEDSAHFLNA